MAKLMNKNELLTHAYKIAETKRGDMDEIESAIGMLIMGHHYGWKVMYLIHSQRTIKHYEDILGVKIREVLPEVGAQAHRSRAWKLAQGFSNFWKIVKGEVPGVKTTEIN